MKMDHEQINIAVNLLKCQGLAVTSPRVADLTGYNQARLYQSGLLSPYLRKRRKRTKSSPKAVVKETLIRTVDSYMEAVQEGYFTHAESLEYVQIEMALNYADFNPSLFTQAINLLIASGKLTQNHQGYVLASVQAVSEQGDILILNETDGSMHWVQDDFEMENKIAALTKSSQFKLKIFKACEVIEVTRKKLH